MWVSWFGWRAASRRNSARGEAQSQRGEARPLTLPPRGPEDIALALRLLPLYRVIVERDGASTTTYPAIWQAKLAAALGEERCQRALRELALRGAADIALCPRELAEHYANELARQAIPCYIEPA